MAWKFFTAQGAEKLTPTSVVNPMARVYAVSGTPTFTTGTWTQLTVAFTAWSADYDTASMWDVANSRFVIPAAGKYRVSLGIPFIANATGIRAANITKNTPSSNVNVVAEGWSPGVVGVNNDVLVSQVMSLNAGDYLIPWAFQNSGGGLGMGTGPNQAAFFSIEKVDGAVVTYVGVPGALVGQELAYAQYSTGNVSVTGVTQAAANVVVSAPAITLDGSTPIIIEGYAYASTKGTTWLQAGITDSVAGGLGSSYFTQNDRAGMVHFRQRVTPSAGAHTFSLAAWVDGGTGTVYAGAGGTGVGVPAFIRITRAA